MCVTNQNIEKVINLVKYDLKKIKQVYLYIFDHHKMFQFCQVGGIGFIFDWTLIINFSNKLRFFGIRLIVEGVMPVLEKSFTLYKINL